MRDQLVDRYNARVKLTGGRSAAFEITLEGKLLFSKLASHRFPSDDEILRLLEQN